MYILLLRAKATTKFIRDALHCNSLPALIVRGLYRLPRPLVLTVENHSASVGKDAYSNLKNTKNFVQTQTVNFRNLIYINCIKKQKSHFTPTNFCLLNTRSVNRKQLSKKIIPVTSQTIFTASTTDTADQVYSPSLLLCNAIKPISVILPQPFCKGQ